MRKTSHGTWILFIAFIAISLGGCSRSIVSDVTRFHNLPAPNGETIEVVSMNPDLQQSLEFGQYAELIGKYLGANGYRPPGGGPSQLIARIGYDIRPAEGVIDGGPRSSVGIGVGGGGRHTNVGIGMSIPLGKKEVRQDYIRILSLEIIRRDTGVKLYEGRATSRGQESLPLTMPLLVDALFQDFPGESGTSNKVRATP